MILSNTGMAAGVTSLSPCQPHAITAKSFSAAFVYLAPTWLEVCMRPLPNTRPRALLFGLGLLAVGCLLAWTIPPYAAPTPSTVAVTRADIESSVTALGTLQPRRYVDVGAQASGQIHTLHVEVGDTVRKGQLLVEIDPSTQQARLDAGRYSIDNLKAQLAEQRAQFQLARQQLKRQRDLAAAGATRDEDVQTATAQLNVTQARIDMFQAQIRQAQASLRSDEAELGYTRIYAPMDGTVVAVDAREGQTLNAQQQTPLILRIARLSPMTVWAQVSEADIGKVKPGMTAYFTTLAGGKRRWTSTVRQVLPVPPKPLEQASQGGGSPASVSNGSAGNQVVQYSVLLDVDNPDGALMAEMTTQVFFVAGKASQVLTVPRAALDEADGLRLARVLTRDGKVEQRQVRTGLSDRLRVQVLDGLSEGERLVIGAPGVNGG